MIRLNQEQRYQIQALYKLKTTQKRIAEIISVHPSTISRELKRNKGKRGYRAKQAHNFAQERQKNKNRAIVFTESMKKMIASLIKKDLSPEQVVGKMLKSGKSCVSHECIYQYIEKDKVMGGNLHTHLRRYNKKKKKMYGKKDTRGQIKDRVSIDKRPNEVDEKKVVGHWETDLVASASRTGYLVTLVERVTKFSLIGYSQTKQADKVNKVMMKLLSPYRSVVRSITSDNGREFADHTTISKKLDCAFYFAHPYASWERGLSENTNGLIRQYFPKGEVFKDSSDGYLRFVEERLNTRPRKTLDFECPKTMFEKHIHQTALAS